MNATNPKPPRATAIKPRRMWASGNRHKLELHSTNVTTGGRKVMVYDLSEPSVADLRDKVAMRLLELRPDRHYFAKTWDELYEIGQNRFLIQADTILAALGLTAKRKGEWWK